MNLLLHDENFARVFLTGQRIKKWMEARAEQIARQTANLQDPNVSIVIRSRNDGAHIKRLLEDIQAQAFSGSIEVIVVDTDSQDDTVTYAQSQGAKIISLKQEEFTYPKALNLGFQVATHPWVVTLVGHSSLSSRLFLKSLTYWTHQQKGLGGVYGLPLTNWNASVWEGLVNMIGPSLWKKPAVIQELSMGIMGANCSVVNREVWQRLGGYDERFAGGGEDRAFAQSMIDHGMTIIREPLCSVFHSHGLSLKDTVQQWRHWIEVAKKPSPFEAHKVYKRRPDLR